jgi:DNA polymerase I
MHGQYNPLGADTGRFSSKNPNMQNIPRGEIREAFVAAPGSKLVIADYSQIELRAAAFFSQDKEMLQAFRDDVDLHKKTAAVVLGKDPDQVTNKDRQIAKAVNFGLLYGMGAAALVDYARTGYGVNLEAAQAQDLRRAFFAHYTGLKQWHDEARNAARNGEVLEGRTAMGRRRLLPHEHTEWHRFQAQTNLVVQGSCADILKNALIELVVVLPPAARLIAVVHDEIIVEAREDVADHVRTVLGYVMKKAAEATLRGVPIEVEAKVCANWGEK